MNIYINLKQHTQKKQHGFHPCLQEIYIHFIIMLVIQNTTMVVMMIIIAILTAVVAAALITIVVIVRFFNVNHNRNLNATDTSNGKTIFTPRRVV